MSRHPTQFDVITAPISENSLWTDVNGGAYPAPPSLPISPTYGIGNESWTLLPVTGVPIPGLPLVCPSNFSPPTRTPPPVESREERKPQGRPRRCPNPRKKAPIRRFSCECGLKFVQKQGLNRHHREKHEPNLCVYCGAEWGRPYEYRDHLEKHHPDVDRDVELGKAAGSRRRSAIFVRRRIGSPPPTIEHSQWGRSGIREYPPAAVKTSTIAPPPPDMTYVTQPESAPPIMMSVFEGEQAHMPRMALPGAPWDEYDGHPSKPVMTLTAPTVDGYPTLGLPYERPQIPWISHSIPFFPF